MKKSEVINKLEPILFNLKSKHRWLDGKLSMSLAQIIIESRWLKSAPGNNCLGIKVPKGKINTWKNKQLLWTKEWDASKGKYISVQAWFMTYPSIEVCIEQGYIRILKLSRYKETRDSIDWWDSTNFIRINGYATSPSYTNTLRNLILKHKLYTIDWRHDYNEQITKNFKYGETFSNVRIGWRTYRRVIENPSEYDNNRQKLMEQLQVGRDYIGKPFVITPNGCVYRIVEYNFQTGGAKESQHLIVNAGDVYTPRGLTVYEFYKIMRLKTDGTGFGLGKNFLHFDRKSSRISVWYY